MEDHQGPFPLIQVAENLLPVLLALPLEIEEVVADLKGCPQMEAEAGQSVEIAGAPGADQSSDPEREDGGVRTRLEQDHVEVISRGEVHHVVRPPAQLDRLTLDCPVK